jgi:hypothetical protein
LSLPIGLPIGLPIKGGIRLGIDPHTGKLHLHARRTGTCKSGPLICGSLPLASLALLAVSPVLICVHPCSSVVSPLRIRPILAYI